MFRFEIKKYAGLCAALIIAFGIIYLVIMCTFQSSYDKNTIQYYEQYISILEGPLTEEKEIYISDENETVISVLESASYYAETGQDIDFEKINYAMLHETAWEMIYERYLNLCSIQDEDEKIFYDDIFWMDFFEKSDVNYLEIFFIIILALFAATNDYHENREIMIKTSYMGNVKYMGVKQGVVAGMTLAAAVLFCLLELISIFVNDKTDMLGYPVRSIVKFSALKWNISIGEYILLRDVNHIFFCILLSLAAFTTGLLVKKIQTGFFLTSVIVVLGLNLNNIVSDDILIWIYSCHLNKEFTLCNYNLYVIIAMALFAFALFTGAFMLWEKKKVMTKT